MSKANDFIVKLPGLAENNGRGLGDLVTELLAPFRQTDLQVLVSCVPLAIGEKTAAAFALVIHELATNSAKYGALSSPDGRLDIKCTCAGDVLRIEWVECGGPPIIAPPENKGFGTRMVARTVEAQLMGTICREFLPSGLRVILDVPLISLAK